MGNLFSEFKRRKALRVAAVYAVVAWLLIQVADVVLPTFNAPQWVNQTIIFLLALGLPIAILLAWAFEITPEGIVSDSEIGPEIGPTIVNSNKQYLNTIVLSFMALAVSFLFVDRYIGGTEPSGRNTNLSLASNDAPSIRSFINLGEMDQGLGTRVYSEIALSPDGGKLAYTTFDSSKRSLHLRELNQFESELIAEFPTAKGPLMPVFSTDSERIAVVEGDDPLAGGLVTYSTTAQRLEAGVGLIYGTGMSWIDENTLLYTSAVDFRPYQKSIVSEAGPHKLIEFEHQGGATQPHMLPGGEALLFVQSTSPVGLVNQGDIYVADLGSEESRLLLPNSFSPRYVPSGHLAFMRGTTLWGVAFDLDQLEVIGDEIPLIRDIDSYGVAGQASFSFSENGRLAYISDTSFTATQDPAGLNIDLFWADRNGNLTSIDTQNMSIIPGTVSRLSPDARQIALTSFEEDGTQDVWLYDIERAVLSRRTFELGTDPVWSADGSIFYYLIGSSLMARASNGIGDSVNLFRGRLDDLELSPDNSFVIFTRKSSVDAGGISRIHSLSLEPPIDFESSEPIIDIPFNTRWPSLSPDGRWLVYGSEESGIYEIYVQPFPDVNRGRWQISTGGGSFPKWSLDGTELYYSSKQPFDVSEADATILSVAVNTDSDFEAEAPKALFTYSNSVPHSGFDVTPEGDRFLIPRLTVEDSNRKQVAVVLVDNWFSELQQLLPGVGR